MATTNNPLDPAQPPGGYDDLSSNPNKYADGRRNHDDLTGDTGAGYANAPVGYWSRPGQGSFAPGPNSSEGAAGTYYPGEADAARYMADGFDSLYGDILGNRQPRDDSDPDAAEINTDQGFGQSGAGRS